MMIALKCIRLSELFFSGIHISGVGFRFLSSKSFFGCRNGQSRISRSPTVPLCLHSIPTKTCCCFSSACVYVKLGRQRPGASHDIVRRSALQRHIVIKVQPPPPDQLSPTPGCSPSHLPINFLTGDTDRSMALAR